MATRKNVQTRSAGKASTTSKQDVFAAAREEKPANGLNEKRAGTVLRIPPSAKDELHAAVAQFATSASLIKQHGDQKDAAAVELAEVALELFCAAWFGGSSPGRPPGPMKLENRNGKSITYVVKDMTKQHELDDQQVASLAAALGRKGLDELLETAETYRIDDDVLQQPGVRKALGEAIAKAKLTPEQRNNLLKVSRVRRFKQESLSDLAKLAGNPARLAEVLKIVGKAVQRYCQA